MYVYIESEPSLWTVGFYQPDGTWVPESDHQEFEAAADRVAYLNGSGAPGPEGGNVSERYLCDCGQWYGDATQRDQCVNSGHAGSGYAEAVDALESTPPEARDDTWHEARVELERSRQRLIESAEKLDIEVAPIVRALDDCCERLSEGLNEAERVASGRRDDPVSTPESSTRDEVKAGPPSRGEIVVGARRPNSDKWQTLYRVETPPLLRIRAETLSHAACSERLIRGSDLEHALGVRAGSGTIAAADASEEPATAPQGETAGAPFTGIDIALATGAMRWLAKAARELSEVAARAGCALGEDFRLALQNAEGLVANFDERLPVAAFKNLFGTPEESAFFVARRNVAEEIVARLRLAYETAHAHEEAKRGVDAALEKLALIETRAGNPQDEETAQRVGKVS